MKLKLFIQFSFVFFATLVASVHAVAATGFTFHGRILNSSNTPVTSANVQFHVQIRSPGVEDCLLFDELHTLNMTGSSGVFVLTIGGGSRSLPAVDGGFSLETIFANRGTLTVPTCTGVGPYVPSANDGRELFVQFSDNGGAWQALPIQNMNTVPMAIEAKQVSGYSKDQLLRVADGVVATEFNLANWNALWDLISGTSSLYMKNDGSGFAPTGDVDYNGQKIVNVADPAAAQDAATKNYVDTNVGGKVLDPAGVSNLAGNGRTLVWDQAQNKWVTGIPNDTTKLALTGDTMLGPINMGAYSVTNVGHVIIADQGTMYLGKFDAAQETTLLTTPVLNNTTDRGRTWFNTATGKMRYWDGTAAHDVASKAYADGVAATAETNANSYSDANWLGLPLTAPTGTEVGKAVRWNAGGTAWEYFTPQASLGYTPVNKAGDTMTGLLLLSGDPSNIVGAATKQYVDAVSTASAGAYVRKDGTTALTTDWDIDGAAGTGFKITGLAAPTVAADAANKTYVDAGDAKLISKDLALPTITQNGQSIRWNNGLDDWEYFTPMTSIAADSLNFTEFSDTLALDASTDIAADGAEVLSITNGGTGNSFLVNDATGGDTTPFVVAADGNVGIGTSTPGALLDLSKSISSIALNTNPLMVLRNNDTTDNNFAAMSFRTLDLGATSVAAARIGTQFTSHAVGGVNGDIYFQTTNNSVGSEKMRIRSDGNVGIGTATPAAKLDVTGNIQASGDITAGGVVYTNRVSEPFNNNGLMLYSPFNSLTPSVSIYGGSGASFVFNTATRAMYPSASAGWDLGSSTNPMGAGYFNGSVGVGTTVPSATLDVKGTFGLSGATSGTLTFAAPATVTSGTYVWPAAAPASDMVLQSSSTGALSWVASGAASIADDSLNFDKFSDALALDASTDIAVDAAEVLSVTNTGTGNSFVVNDQAADTTPFVVDTAGLVGIGTATPSSLLHLNSTTAGVTSLIESGVAGAVAQDRYTSLTAGSIAQSWGAGLNIVNGNGGYEIYDYTDAATRFYIDGDGEVAIGGTTTNAKLDVKGTLGLSGATSGAVTFAAPATVTSGAYVWPAAMPASNMVLQSSNTGALSWVTAGGLTNFTESVVTAAPNATIPAAVLQATNAAASVDFVLSPKYQGALIFGPAPDNTATGGNKRGLNAIDLSSGRGGAAQVASGGSSVLIGGYSNSATANNSMVAAGNFNTASGAGAIVTGGSGNAASGDATLAAGSNVTSQAFAQATFGQYNVLTGGTAASWVSTDALFVIGNGTSSLARSNAVTVLKNGNVGIGASPRTGAKFDVNGTVLMKASTPNATTAIDFATGNLQHTALDCQAFTLTGMQDGGSYTFAVKGAGGGTCSFTHAGFTVRMPADHAAATATKHTLYSFLVMGTDIYVTWMPDL